MLALSTVASDARAMTTAEGGGALKSIALIPPFQRGNHHPNRAVRFGFSGERIGLEHRQPRLDTLELPLRLFPVVLKPLNAGRQFGGQNGDQSDACGNRVAQGSISPQHANAAEKLDSRAASEPLG